MSLPLPVPQVIANRRVPLPKDRPEESGENSGVPSPAAEKAGEQHNPTQDGGFQALPLTDCPIIEKA